jgi:hypothetical protein
MSTISLIGNIFGPYYWSIVANEVIITIKEARLFIINQQRNLTKPFFKEAPHKIESFVSFT